MASSMDFKDLFERYQRVGAKNGISIVNYCFAVTVRQIVYGKRIFRRKQLHYFLLYKLQPFIIVP